MLPSLNQLADGSDDAAVKARAATVALLLGGIGLQDGFYTNHSITSVIGRLEGAEGADAARIEPALTALKHLRDVLETRDQLSREVTTERTSSDPIDINAADEVPGSSSFSRPQSSLGGSIGGGGGGGGSFTFGGGGGSFSGGNRGGGTFGGDATDELRRLSLADDAPPPLLQGRPSSDFGSGGFAAAGLGGAGFGSVGRSGSRVSGDFGPVSGFGGQRADSFGAGSFGPASLSGWASGDSAATFGGRASSADFSGGQAAGGGAPGSPYGSPTAASYRRRTMDSHSPGASMRMLQSDLRKVALTDDTQDDFYGSL